MPLGRPLGLLVVLTVVVATAIALERLRPAVPREVPLLGIRADDVVAVRIEEGTRELQAVRQGDAWRVEVPPGARPDAGAAVAEMVGVLVELVPLDTFVRQEIDRRAFGIKPARVRIQLGVRGSAEPVVLLLGDYVPTGGSVYCALASDQRIHQIGAIIMSELEKAFYRTLPEQAREGEQGR